MYESNASGDRCHTSQRIRESKYSEVNEALYKWYLIAVSKNVFPDGTQLSEKAKEIANQLGFDDFRHPMVGWIAGRGSITLKE